MFDFNFASFVLCKNAVCFSRYFCRLTTCAYLWMEGFESGTSIVSVCKSKTKKKVFYSIFIKNDELYL